MTETIEIPFEQHKEALKKAFEAGFRASDNRDNGTTVMTYLDTEFVDIPEIKLHWEKFISSLEIKAPDFSIAEKARKWDELYTAIEPFYIEGTEEYTETGGLCTIGEIAEKHLGFLG